MRQLVLILVGCCLVGGMMITGCRKPAVTTTPLVGAPGPTEQAKGMPGGVVGEIKAYIPCGMIIPIRAAIQAFEAKNPGVKIKGVYDNAGIIVKRLTEKHERADVVVSPGQTEMAALEKAGLIDVATKRTIGTFELVCIVPATSKKAIAKPADLKQCKTIAMPDPKVNSVGTAGQQALTKLGLWEALKPKMFMPAHAIEAHTMVAAGKAEAGISYRNCPLDTNPEKLSKSKVRIAFAFPSDSYEKPPCLVAVAAQAGNKVAATAFVEFLASPEGLKILGENGLTGCLELAGSSVPSQAAAAASQEAAPQKAVQPLVTVVAFYPDNEGHKAIKELVLSLPKKYGPRVQAEFVDFTTDEGFKRWHDEKGLTCGTILINDQQTWTYVKNGKVHEVTFKMRLGGEWTKEDLYAVIEKILKEKEAAGKTKVGKR